MGEIPCPIVLNGNPCCRAYDCDLLYDLQCHRFLIGVGEVPLKAIFGFFYDRFHSLHCYGDVIKLAWHFSLKAQNVKVTLKSLSQ